MKTKCLKKDDECQLSNLYYNDVVLNARIRTSHNLIEYIKGMTWKYKQIINEFVLYSRSQIKHIFNNTRLGRYLELQRYIKEQNKKNVDLLIALKASEAESSKLAQDIIKNFKIYVKNEEHAKILNKVLLISENAPIEKEYEEYKAKITTGDYYNPTLFVECCLAEAKRVKKEKED